MTDLSPAAQAVLDAYWASPWDPSLQQEDRYAIAAALREVNAWLRERAGGTRASWLLDNEVEQ
jgi:hypothetical protein